MLLTEYNEADAKELFKKEGFRRHLIGRFSEPT